MRFVFLHHEPFGPFTLAELYSGANRYGGSVARLRLLFWMAARGHEVRLVGTVETGEWKGVRAIQCDGKLEALAPSGGIEPTVFVMNNPPAEAQWQQLHKLKSDQCRIVLWAGNPFDWIWLRRAAACELDRIVCVSHAHREVYRLYPGFEKIEVLYSGVDTDLMAAVPATPISNWTVLSISVPRRTKGFHNVLKAWRTVHAAVPDARLRVCGSARMHAPDATLGHTGVLDADLEAEFPDLFGNHPQSTQQAGIDLMGPRSLPEVYGDLKAAAVAVVNSNWRGSTETFCRSAVEAQIAGIPVVGAARGSLPEVVAHGKTGLLVDRENPEALAEAIITLLKDDLLRRRMGAAGPEWARPFADYALIAQQWYAIADRVWRGEPAHVAPRQPHDLLRRLGYGKARMRIRPIVRKLLSHL